MLFLIVLLAVLAGIIWAAVTRERISLEEATPRPTLEEGDFQTVGDLEVRIVENGASPRTTFLFHDADVAGSVMLGGVIDSLGDGVKTIAVDLPGFGLSSRIPGESTEHTVASMADRMIEVIEARSFGPVVLAGVGLGGEVAAEVATIDPDLVAGLVLVDVDFYTEGGWERTLERLPWLGVAATYGFSTAHTIEDTTFAPFCDEGGWCPTPEAATARSLAVGIIGTTESVNGFRRTRPASDVPARLGDITANTILIWSEKGSVPESSVERAADALDVVITKSDTFQAHLEAPGVIAEAIRQVTP